MRANYQQLVKAHQQVARNLGNEKEDENSKISKIYLWKGADSDGRPCSWWDKIPSVSGRLDHLKLYIVVHRRVFCISNAGFHGLPLPIVQPASLDAQLCRAFRLRFLLDWGTVQTRGSPGAKKEKHCFFCCRSQCLLSKDLIYSILRRTGNSDGERSQSPQDPAYQSSR